MPYRWDVVWTSEELRELIVSLRERGGDTTELEVKLGAGGCPGLGPTLCAFGNMPSGGTIIVGLDEGRNFAAAGVQSPAEMEAGIAAQARTAVVPPVQVTFEEAEVDGAVVVIATVYPVPSSQRPCRHQGHAYLRQADGDYVMSEQEAQQVLAMRERPRNDAVPMDGATVDDLDSDLVTKFLSQARATSRRLATEPDSEVLERKGVLAPDGNRPTLAGLYALGSYPQEFLPSLSLTAAVQLDPRTGDRTRDLVHLDGPLPALLDGAMEWVARNTQTTIRFGPDGHGRDLSEIPMIAVRELIANALIHRDLGQHTQGKRVELRLTGDLLVIANPGGLYGVSRQQLGAPGGKSAVNEYLYDICKLTRTEDGARLIEGEGGGIREVQRVLQAANMRQPRFVDTGVTFTVLIPRHSLIPPLDVGWLTRLDSADTLNDVQRRILVGIRHGEEWTNRRVREEFAPIDSREAKASLQDLVSRGLAVALGARGQTSYVGGPHLDHVDEVDAFPQVTILGPRGSDDPLVDQEPLFEAVPQLTGLSKNASAIWAALESEPLSAHTVAARTGLSLRQVRYALQRLADTGYILILGGRGHRDTSYRRIERSP